MEAQIFLTAINFVFVTVIGIVGYFLRSAFAEVKEVVAKLNVHLINSAAETQTIVEMKEDVKDIDKRVTKVENNILVITTHHNVNHGTKLQMEN